MTGTPDGAGEQGGEAPAAHGPHAGPLQLRAVRAGLQRLWWAIATFGAGLLAAALPLGGLLAIPATLLFVAGLIAVPMTAWHLRQTLRTARDHDGPAGRDRPRQD